jgi:transcriptional regulator with XRE-family HTH domain
MYVIFVDAKYNSETRDKTYEPLQPGMPLTFGTLLRHIRKSRGLTLAQLSNASGIDPATISKMELGDRLPPELHIVVRIATALEIPEGSEGFKALVTLALDERASAGEAIAENEADPGTSGNPVSTLAWNVLRPTEVSKLVPVFVEDLAELIARSTAEAIRRSATSITIRFEDGSTKRYEVLKHYEGVEVV